MAHSQVSIATVVDLAQKNSTTVRIATADVSKANSVLWESRDALIPSIGFGTGLPVFPEIGFTGQPPSIWSATVQSLVYSIPQKRYIDAANLGVQASKARLKDAREQVALDASTAYIELDTVNQQLADALQQESFAAKLIDIERQRTEAGVDPTSELLQAKLQAAQLKLNRIHLQSRSTVLEKQLSVLTGLPLGSIKIDHSSIPEIPQVHGLESTPLHGVQAANFVALSKGTQAKGDREANYLPELRFFVQYNRNTTILNDVNTFFAKPLPANNFASGISVQIPLFDMLRYARARESAADALRSKVEAEQAQKQNDIAVVQASAGIAELDAQAEIASLKQQISSEQLTTVIAQLEVGNGSGSGPGSQPQASPKAEQLARIDERQKVEDAREAGFDLAKARLNLLRALGHMDDWLKELRGK
ncbi:MAG: TolC family protein [Acidobacteria bacterium]|nr:TolC family protein [Acidobacteriota bacterium]